MSAFLRFTLLTVAVLAGIYAALTWALGMLTDAGVGAAISGVSVVVAEAIWWCTESRERPRCIDWELCDLDDWRGVWPLDAGAPE